MRLSQKLFTFCHSISLGLSRCLLFMCTCIWYNCGHMIEVWVWLHRFFCCFCSADMAALLATKSSNSNLQRICYLIDDNLLVHHYHLLNMLNLLISGMVDWHPAPSLCIMLVQLLLNFSLYSCTLLCSNALSLYCAKSLWLIF